MMTIGPVSVRPIVSPSAGACATNSAPIEAPAPGLYSLITGWPSRAWRWRPMMRAVASVAPPAPYPSTSRIRRCGGQADPGPAGTGPRAAAARPVPEHEPERPLRSPGGPGPCMQRHQRGRRAQTGQRSPAIGTHGLISLMGLWAFGPLGLWYSKDISVAYKVDR